MPRAAIIGITIFVVVAGAAIYTAKWNVCRDAGYNIATCLVFVR